MHRYRKTRLFSWQRSPPRSWRGRDGGNSGCAVNPATGKRQINLVSSSRELAMGEEADPAIIAEYGLYGDRAVQSYVDSIGQKLGASPTSPRSSGTSRPRFAGGERLRAAGWLHLHHARIMAYVGSNRNWPASWPRDRHVTARHSAQQMTQQQIAGIGLLAGAIFVDAFRPTAARAAGLGLLFLKYGRDHETQADELGIQYAARAGYDPRTSRRPTRRSSGSASERATRCRTSSRPIPTRATAR